MLRVFTYLDDFIRNCFLLVLSSIPLFCAISFSFKGFGNYCNPKNKQDKTLWHQTALQTDIQKNI